MKKLSVVLISRNQEWNISRLIVSVLEETASLPLKEIVLVDSASTDNTTEIAAKYPIVVLKLHPDQHLSASAGRFVGFKHSSGDLVLFLDGDMELINGWLLQALEIMEHKPEVGVVCGRVLDRPIEMKSSGKQRGEVLPGEETEISEVLHGGGASLFRRLVLEEVATFNPFLYSDEEPELCLRIRNAGYKILKLNQPIVFHYTVEWEALTTFLNKRKNNIWLGYGQNLRYYLGTPFFWHYLKERGWVIPPAIFTIVGLITLIMTIFTRNLLWFGSWILLLILITLLLAIRKRSLKNALIILIRRWLILEGSIKGFFQRPFDPESYPGRFDLIQNL